MRACLVQGWSSLLSSVLAASFFAFGGLSCTGPESTPDTDLQFDGVVHYRKIEGGAWVIKGDDGTTYEPTDLPEEYREEGLRVRVWADRLEDQASIRMVGPIITIEHIERRREE